jgi:hypothetical protein
MTNFEKHLMQGLSKYYKENYHDFKISFRNILRILQEYFPKSSHKSSQKVGGCGSCYPVCTHTYCILKNVMC